MKENNLERMLFEGDPSLKDITKNYGTLNASFIISGASTEKELDAVNKKYEKLSERFGKYIARVEKMAGYELNSQQKQLVLNEYVGIGKFKTYTTGDSEDDFEATRIDTAIRNALSYNPFKTISRCVGTSGLNLFLGEDIGQNLSLLTNDEHMFLKLETKSAPYTVETAGTKNTKQVLPLNESLIENGGFTEWPKEHYPLFLLINRAYSKKERGNFNGAIDDLNKAISLDKKFYPAYFTLGEFFSENKDYENATRLFNEGLKFQPEKFAKNKTQNPNAIMHYFSEALYNNRAVVKASEGDYPAAISDYNEALKIRPNSPQIFSNRGFSKEKLGDFKGAYMDYTKAIILNRDVYEEKDNPELFEKRAGLALKLGKTKKAMSDANHAIANLNSENPQIYFTRAKAREQLKLYSLAINDYAEAKKIKDKRIALASKYRTRLSKSKKAYKDFVKKVKKEKVENIKVVKASPEIQKALPDEEDIFTDFEY